MRISEALTEVTTARMLAAIAVALAMVPVGFYFGMLAYIFVVDLLYPGSNSMAGLGGAVIGLIFAPLCALCGGFSILCWPALKRPKKS